MASISSVDGEGPWWESGLEEGGEYLKVCAYVGKIVIRCAETFSL